MESNGLCMTHNDLCVYSPEFENKSENRKKNKPLYDSVSWYTESLLSMMSVLIFFKFMRMEYIIY